MSRRISRLLTIAALATAVAGATAVSDASASQRSTVGSAERGVDADEAQSVALRGQYQQSITAAPALAAPAAGLVAATRAAAALPTAPGRWEAVTNKPFLNDPVARGADYGEGYFDVTGRLTALTHSGSVVYAASASGGVWESRNQGSTWIPLDAGLPRLAVGALGTDPADGSVWAGTGEANNASENQYGVGVYRLARGSHTWRQVGGAELYGAGSFRIAFIRGYVYVATSHGLYRRSHSAAWSSPWRAVLQPAGDRVYPPSSSVTDVLALPGSHGRKVLAAVGWAGYSTPPETANNGFWVGTGAREASPSDADR